MVFLSRQLLVLTTLIVLVAGMSSTVQAGYLGIKIDDHKPTGARVVDVFPNSPAELLGLPRGVVIIEFNGSKVENAKDLARIVGSLRARRWYSYQYIRDKKYYIALVSLFESSSTKPVTGQEFPPVGLIGIEIKSHAENGVRGARIVSVKAGKPAAAAGLQVNDIIVGVGGTQIQSSNQLTREIFSRPDSEETFALLRNNRRLYLRVKIKGYRVVANTKPQKQPVASAGKPPSSNTHWCARDKINAGACAAGAVIVLGILQSILSGNSKGSSKPRKQESPPNCRPCTDPTGTRLDCYTDSYGRRCIW